MRSLSPSDGFGLPTLQWLAAVPPPATQDPIDDLVFSEAAQNRDVLPIREQVQKTTPSAEELRSDLTCGHRGILRRCVERVELVAAEELENDGDIERQLQRKARYVFAY